MKFYSFIIFLLLSSASSKYFRIFDKPKDIIKVTTLNEHEKPYNITYLIRQPDDKITTIKILQLKMSACKSGSCCEQNYLSITEKNGNIHKFCDNADTKRLSLRSIALEIKLQIEKGNAELLLEYKSRNNTQCPDHEFECTDESSCYNSTEICDLQFVCKDHSDEVGCAYCAKHLVPCDTWSNICFDPIKQRCDKLLDCPKGEDEQGCFKKCEPADIYCSADSKCLQPNQLCDDKIDCPGGFDEVNCDKQYCKSPPYFLCNNGMCIQESLVGNGIDDCGDISDEMKLFQLVKTCTMALLIIFLSLLFTSLIIRWCSNRRDVHGLLLNLPEFPLPPFQGPGEQGRRDSYNLGYSDSDFRVGGDVYEAFARFRRRLEAEDKNNESNVVSSRTHSGCVNFNTSGQNCDIETVKAILSLNLPHKLCIGLDKYIVEMMEKSYGNQAGYTTELFGKCYSR